MTDAPVGFVDTLLRDTTAIAVQFSDAITDAAMASIERATPDVRWPFDRESLRSAIQAGIFEYLSAEIDDWRKRQPAFGWRYDRVRRRLFVTGPSVELPKLKPAIQREQIAENIDAIVFTTPTYTFLLTGGYLRQWLAKAFTHDRAKTGSGHG